MKDKLEVLIKEIARDLGCIHDKLKEECNTLAYLSVNMVLVKLDDYIQQYEIDRDFNNKEKHHLDFNKKYIENDSVVEQVIEKFQERSEKGIKKYGTTLADNDLSFDEWLTHLQEELMDAVVYLQKIKSL
jgi:hypothetical protein